EASDMVLADDNFATIVAAVEEGRGIYRNIQKVVGFLLGTNTGEVLFLLMVLLSGIFLPQALPLALLPIHILWVNLVTDGVCDVTLAMEPKERGLMRAPPRNPNEKLVTFDMEVFIALTAVVIAVGTFVVFYSHYRFDEANLAYARTMTFTSLAMFQLWSAINARSRFSFFRIGIFSNKYLLGAIVLSLLMQIFAVYHPMMNEAMSTVPLSLQDWIYILLVTASLFVLFEVKKIADAGWRLKHPEEA
ncbi:MAG: cation transporting ATPase C-terminal domain-containing protein, partial [Candidatus Micrarchaeota archaeon]